MTPLEDTLSKEMSKILAEEIDWEVMVDMIASVGWIKVDLPRINNRYHSIDIEVWVEENCRGKHMKRGRTFVFERKEDAEWFSLRWL